MGQKAFISDADTALANLIWNCIENDSALKKAISSQEQISFSSPKTADLQGTRKLCIFLYNITLEAAANAQPPTEDGSKKPAETLALSYLVTPFIGNDGDDHALLEKIVQAVSAKPMLFNAGEQGNVGFRVKVDSLSFDELTRLWGALGAPLKASVSLTLYPEPSSDLQTRVATGPDLKVNELYQAVLQTFTEQSSDWRKRNMVMKQWVFNDFKKSTDMTVDDMLSALNGLGDRLEQHGSTAQFINPLNMLARYYEHQLEQLKGFQKVSHKQKENVELVDKWLKDVRALVEALGSQA